MKYIYLVLLIAVFGAMAGCSQPTEPAEQTGATTPKASTADTQGNKPMTRPDVGKPE
jgi:hypothetical protein